MKPKFLSIKNVLMFIIIYGERIMKKYSIKEVKQFIEVESNSRCKLISKEYKNNKTKLDIMCKCGQIYSRTYDSFKNGKQYLCKECGINKMKESQKLSYEEVKEYIENFGFKLVSTKYENAHKNLKLCCKKNHIFKVTFNDFKQGNRCPECRKDKLSKKFRKPIEEIYEIIKQSEFTFVRWENEYRNCESKFILKCDDGHEFISDFDNFYYSKNGCPICRESKGEKKIAKFLEINNIKFERQYKFKNCKYIKILPFDFAIFNEDNSIKCLIEYDGKQHFKPINLFGGEEEFKVRQIRDKVKEKFCKENNIKLIRIPYTDFKNIDNILNTL